MNRALRGNQRAWLGYVAAVGAGASYGGAQTVGKYVTTEFTTPLVASGFALLFGFLYISILFHRHIPNDIFDVSSRAGLVWFALSGVFSGCGVCLLYLALDRAPLVVVSPVVAINPMVTLLLTHILLKRLEKISIRTILGSCLVVTGVVVVIVSKIA